MKYELGRWWGVPYYFYVVEKDLTVVSRHRLHRRAKAKAKPGQGILRLIGNQRHDYKPGMKLNYEDINWRATTPQETDKCSECLASRVPKSLEYRCPGYKDNPLCIVVELNVVKEKTCEI